MKWSDRTTYQGRAVNRGTLAILKSANLILQSSPRYGREKEDMTLVQGGYNRGGVAASAGTHDGGAAFDITAFNWKNRVRVLRMLGTATWYRPTIRNLWSHHLHGIVCGDGTASRGALAQVTEYYQNGDGLVGNAKDPNWRPKALPILYVAPWTERGRQGVYYLTKNQTMYDQPTNSGSSTGNVKKGAKFTVAAIVNVRGHLWAINIHGNCVPKSSLTRNRPSKPSKPSKKEVTLNVGTLNVIRWRLGEINERGVADFKRGKSYEKRVKGLAKIRHEMGVSIFTTTESGQYKDADALTKEMGDDKWSNVLHGDAGDLTNAIHVHEKRKRLDSGKFLTEGVHHNWATWGIYQDKTGSDVIFMLVAYHADHRARGMHSASQWDKLRETQTQKLIDSAQKIASNRAKGLGLAKIPIIFAGDFNQDKDDVYDGPGRAMTAKGYSDFETLAPKKSGPETTYNGLKKDQTSGRRYDRVFGPKGTPVRWMRTVAGYPDTDHNGVSFSITISNE